jgi:dipeptidyl aminopeptidase/acylaminoacyl peptidase
MRKRLLISYVISLFMGASIASAEEVQKTDEYVKNTKVVQDIPIIEYYKTGSGKRPLLILSHGFSGRKSDFFQSMETIKGLANKGFYIVAMDNRGHGERKGPTFSSRVIKDSKINIFEIRKLIKESADDVSTLIDYYETNSLIDMNQIGITGCSMGGFITFRAMMIDSRIKAAAPMIGSPTWEDIPREVAQPLSIEQNKEAMDNLKELSQQYCPNYFPDKFYGRNLLIQNGAQDMHVNIAEVKKFYDVISENSPQTITMITYPGIGHKVTPEMLTVTTEWLCKKLIL